MANASVIPAPRPVSLGEEMRLAEREQVWAKLVQAGLAWQPDPGLPSRSGSVLTLSSSAEWTAEHLKDAALHVLRVEAALREMDWTIGSVAAHWVQFAGCRPAWISQSALRPGRGRHWAARQDFVDRFLTPLLERSQGGGRTGWWRRLAAPLDRLLPAMFSGGARDELSGLLATVEEIKARRRWSPWTNSRRILEPAGPAAILAREEAVRHGVRLVYEWRGKSPASAPLRPWPGVVWVRFHESEEEAAADYLEQRAMHNCVLPLWNRTGDPMGACPHRAEADLLVAVGKGNVPEDAPELARFARVVRRMAPLALVEYAGAENPGGWKLFLDTMRTGFRAVHVTETGPGRRACLLERA